MGIQIKWMIRKDFHEKEIFNDQRPEESELVGMVNQMGEHSRQRRKKKEIGQSPEVEVFSCVKGTSRRCK